MGRIGLLAGATIGIALMVAGCQPAVGGQSTNPASQPAASTTAATAAITTSTEVPSTTTTTLPDLTSLSVVAGFIGCDGDCEVTGITPMPHPTWGEVQVVTWIDKTAGELGESGIKVLDATGQVVWDHPLLDWGSYGLAPVASAQTPTGSGQVAARSVDTLGHLFIVYNPGRYDGVIVLAPIPGGFADFHSLPQFDANGEPFGAGFYYAQVTDVEGDGQFEIQAFFNDCIPGCALARQGTVLFYWDGTGYSQRPVPDQTVRSVWTEMEEALQATATAIEQCVTPSDWVCDADPEDLIPTIWLVGSESYFWSEASQFAGRFLRPGDEGYAVPDPSATDAFPRSTSVQKVLDEWPAYVGEPSPDAKTLVNRTARVLFDAGVTMDGYVDDMCMSSTPNFDCGEKTYDVYHIASEIEDLVRMWDSWN